MMQLRLPWAATAPGRARPGRELVVGDRTFPVVVRRHRRARRYILRVQADGRVRLTVPSRASVSEGLRFAAGQTDWVQHEWQRLQRRITWQAGTTVWYRGTLVTLRVQPGSIRCGDLRVTTGPSDDLRERVQAAMRAAAERELPVRCRELAAGSRLLPSRVTVRDQRSRWGACSGTGAVTLNWRLIQMPASVSDYVMLHELAHLKQPNHSSRFWRLVGSICPTWERSEQWLRRFGGDLL
jgi:predicted metal-dependent hydrolase